MNVPLQRAGSSLSLHRELEEIWRTTSPEGWRSLSAVNHTVVGKRFIITSFAFFLIGGVLAMLIRAQLSTSATAFMGPEQYNQVFTMHGTIMMFLFAIPLIEGLALYLLPKMLGARDLAFPRLSAFGYWCYLFGGSMLLMALFTGYAPNSGWFMYTPLSSRPFSPGINADVWLLGITFVEVSAIAAAVEIITTILKVRAAGMGLQRMPLLVWYLLVTFSMILVGFPPLILGSILLEVERAFSWPFFDPTRGGSPLLWQHLFWIFGHPEVYIIFLPAAGVLSTIIPVFARHPIVGYTWIVASIIALGFISFGLWVHHMFTVGIPHLAVAFFSAASLAVVFPTAIQIFAWTATMLKGRPRFDLPMLYVLGFFFIFVLGGLTGVMVAIVPFDWQVHDTHFVVAHLHYVLIGGFVFPLLAGAYYWLPNMTGRRPVLKLGVPAFWLIFVGFNLTFLVMHVTGLLGMPRRVYTYSPDMNWDWPNLISSFGGFLLAMGFALFTADVVLQAWTGRRAPRNIWQAETLEWAMPLPPRSYNFGSIPVVHGRRPLEDDPELPSSLAGGCHLLARPRNGWRETLGVNMLTGAPEQIVILPSASWLPLWTALAAAVFFLSMLWSIYVLAVVGALGVLVLSLVWAWSGGLKEDSAPLPIGNGVHALPHYATADSPTYLSAVFTVIADATLFASLVFGYLFLFIMAPEWPPAVSLELDLLSVLAAVVGLGGAFLAQVRASAGNASGRDRSREVWLAVASLGGILAAVGFAAIALATTPHVHAYWAMTASLAYYAAFHAVLGSIISGFALFRCRAGYVSAQRKLELQVAMLWWLFSLVSGLIVLVLLHGIPMVHVS